MFHGGGRILGIRGDRLMKKMKVGIVGAGQMGTQIGKVASDDHDVIFYDIDRGKSRHAADKLNVRYEDELHEILRSHIIFLAVPGNAVIELLKEYQGSVSKETLWVNISTFVTLKEMISVTGDGSNLVSCKIIGHFEMMSPTNPCAFVIHQVHPENDLTSIVEKIFKRVGITIYDDENKYLEINYIAAAEAMRGVLNVAKLLRSLDIQFPIIEAAIKQVFVGSAGQFPYANPDYFHDLVYKRNPELKKLNQEILNLSR
jgi:hypothetical protein